MSGAIPEAFNVNPNEVKEYNRLILPLVTLATHPDAVSGMSSEGILLHASLFNRLQFSGPLTELTRDGDFGNLSEYASTVAAEVSDDFTLDLPKTFAVHAIASVHTALGRASDDKAPESSDRATYFLTQFAARLAVELTVNVPEGSSDPHHFANAISQRTGRLAVAYGEPAEWLNQKMLILGNNILRWRHMSRMVSREIPLQTDDLNNLRRNNDVLLGELRRLERFNINTELHRGLDSNWSIGDLIDMRMRIAGIATGEIRPDRWRPAMVMWALEHQTDFTPEMEILLDSSKRPNYDAFGRCVFMGENGQLFCDLYGMMPLYPLYEHAGKVTNYEVLRQFLIQQYFDISMPGSIVTVARENTRVLVGDRSPELQGSQGAVVNDLLLPRIRLLKKLTPDKLDRLETS